MSLISIEEFKALVERHQERCVSIYMPTYKAGPETRQNPIRFKNMMKQAEAQLQELDASLNLLQPALELDNNDFWQHQDEGLAIFAAEGFFRRCCCGSNTVEWGHCLRSGT
jgi:hypothetical protein